MKTAMTIIGLTLLGLSLALIVPVATFGQDLATVGGSTGPATDPLDMAAVVLPTVYMVTVTWTNIEVPVVGFDQVDVGPSPLGPWMFETNLPVWHQTNVTYVYFSTEQTQFLRIHPHL